MRNFVRKDIKVILMVSAPLSERWHGYYCTDILNNIFDLEYWDCSNVVAHPFVVSTSLSRAYVKLIVDYDDLKRRLNLLPNKAIIIEEIPFQKENECFHKLVSARFPVILHFDFLDFSLAGVLKEYDRDKSRTAINLLGKLKREIYKIDIIKLFIKFVRYRGKGGFKKELDLYRAKIEYKKERHIHQFDRYKKIINISCKDGERFYINHPDYEKYLSVCNNTPIRNDKFVVFLDQYYPYHPDMQMNNELGNIQETAAKYHASLNKFFLSVEKQYSCRVIIAGHPSADYHKNPFEGREIVYFKTAELVKDCFAVCMHYSYSFNFVALWDKPMIILTNSALYEYDNMERVCIQFSKAIGIPLLNTDVHEEHILFHKIDPDVNRLFLLALTHNWSNVSNADLLPQRISEAYDTL